MTVVGLIGKIGAGKTTVARLLGQYGATVIDADALTHDALKEGAVQERIRDRFGSSVFVGDVVNRSCLAELVFGDQPEHKKALQDLEEIIHPRVRHALEERLRRIDAQPLSKKASGVVVLDVPLLVQARLHNRCDRLIWLECEDSVRHQRLVQRGMSAGQVAAREEAWIAGFQKDSVPDHMLYIVDTSGDIAYTIEEIEKFWEELSHRSS
jgi:dephospho-CoA kinase